MSLHKWLRAVAITTACLGMIIPTQCLLADEPNTVGQPVAAVDVAIGEDGSLTGIVVDGSGQPKPALPVYIQQFETNVATATSNDSGEFRCQLTGGGIYLLAAGDQVVLLRCWAPGTAPPQARTRLVVQASDVVRGQIHPAACGLANPWVITGIAVAAIAIPVALHNNRVDRDDGSE